MEDLLSTDACTMPTEERPLRLAEFDALFASDLERIEDGDDGVRLHLAGAPGLAERVRDLAARESACCSFFTFVIDGDDRALRLEIAVPSERRDILDSLVARARELSA